MPSLTPNYDFQLPLVNDPIDADLWGNELNANWSSIDGLLKAVSDNAASAVAYVDIGDLKPTSRATAPSKWLLCYGQAISRTTYGDLYAAIGNTWGAGDGTTTFNVPDFRGRALIGKDDMGGTSANRITTPGAGFDGDVLGATGGNEFLQTHNHTATVTDPGHTHNATPNNQTPGGLNGFANTGNSSNTTTTYNLGTATTGITVTNADAGTGTSQNVQPSAVVNWLIYAGI